jgi:phage antirepressor YoqD-like protein
MKENKMSFNISTMCKILKVSQSCYYQWIKQGSIIHKIDEQLNELIKEIFEQSNLRYKTNQRSINEKIWLSYVPK